MVGRAEQQGLVTRRAPGRIGATAAITNTAAGEKLLRQAHVWQDEVLRTLTAGWSDEDVKTLMNLMDRLVRAPNAIDSAGPNARPR
jgi:MarR family transcriptional regulator, organic hydroperoxide resistance regulator